MKGTGRDEQDMIGANHSVTTVYGRSLDDGKNVALHSLTRNVRAMSRLSSGNLVDLVEKNYSRTLNSLDGRTCDLLHIDEALFFFLHQIFHRLVHAQLASFRASLKQVTQHVFHVDAHLFDALRASQLYHWKVFLSDFELNQTVIELAAA